MDTIQAPGRALAADRLSWAPHAAIDFGAAVLGWVLSAYVRRQSRLHLADLDDRILADIGLSRDDAAREIAKPLWR